MFIVALHEYNMLQIKCRFNHSPEER